VERTTRFTMLLRLSPMEGHDTEPRVKNGPPLAGNGAETVRDAMADQIMGLSEQVRRSLWDQCAELAQHVQLRIDAGLAIYFADPHTRSSAAPTRTTASCVGTSQVALTSRPTVVTNSTPWPPPSTRDRVKLSPGRRQRKHSTNFYALHDRLVLRQPLNPSWLPQSL
jgi:hypothetical protein